jgi:hypothetical protein
MIFAAIFRRMQRTAVVDWPSVSYHGTIGPYASTGTTKPLRQPRWGRLDLPEFERNRPRNQGTLRIP